ncbi:hypothetical protein [Roseivivax lentus]|uniref:hypothetical protein n=1 Tax=Roseivivax lentus TaxID=633194 RepID=UPI00117BA7BC|nr:hypothetical protein [Roseivivax lentus]
MLEIAICLRTRRLIREKSGQLPKNMLRLFAVGAYFLWAKRTYKIRNVQFCVAPDHIAVNRANGGAPRFGQEEPL